MGFLKYKKEFLEENRGGVEKRGWFSMDLVPHWPIIDFDCSQVLREIVIPLGRSSKEVVIYPYRKESVFDLDHGLLCPRTRSSYTISDRERFFSPGSLLLAGEKPFERSMIMIGEAGLDGFIEVAKKCHNPGFVYNPGAAFQKAALKFGKEFATINDQSIVYCLSMSNPLDVLLVLAGDRTLSLFEEALKWCKTTEAYRGMNCEVDSSLG
jgi:hypothetical protein